MNINEIVEKWTADATNGGRRSDIFYAIKKAIEEVVQQGGSSATVLPTDDEIIKWMADNMGGQRNNDRKGVFDRHDDGQAR